MSKKIECSQYIEEEGVSIVKIKTKHGYFCGESHLWEEDKENASSYAGCQYAEIKANIAYVKHIRKKLKEKYKILNDAAFNIMQAKDTSYDSKEFCVLNNIIKGYEKQIKSCDNKIKRLEKTLFNVMDVREKALEKLNKGKKS